MLVSIKRNYVYFIVRNTIVKLRIHKKKLTRDSTCLWKGSLSVYSTRFNLKLICLYLFIILQIIIPNDTDIPAYNQTNATDPYECTQVSTGVSIMKNYFSFKSNMKNNHNYHHLSSLDGMLEAADTNLRQVVLFFMSCWI